jgi:hypothetical protein
MLVAMTVIVESVEMMLIVVMVVVMIIKVVTVVLKLGALTESPFHPHLATHRLAPSIPAPPTIYT